MGWSGDERRGEDNRGEENEERIWDREEFREEEKQI